MEKKANNEDKIMWKVMIVDDEKLICKLVQALVEWDKLGMQMAAQAENAIQALDMLQQYRPDILITDIRMPGMDGLELMSKVRDILPFTVFIILTNYAEFSYAKQAISLGAREYILKSEMRSSDIQRIVAEIAATTAKIRSEKVHDVLQDGVVDLLSLIHI